MVKDDHCVKKNFSLSIFDCSSPNVSRNRRNREASISFSVTFCHQFWKQQDSICGTDAIAPYELPKSISFTRHFKWVALSCAADSKHANACIMQPHVKEAHSLKHEILTAMWHNSHQIHKPYVPNTSAPWIFFFFFSCSLSPANTVSMRAAV